MHNRASASKPDDFALRFEGLVSSSVDLPTLPTILWEIQAALQDTKNDSAAVAMVVEQDPSLTVSVLRSANSAHYGAASPIYSIKDAVSHIGRHEVERIVSTTVIIDTFAGVGGSLDYKPFWTHSLQVAEAALFVTEANPTSSPFIPTEAYIAGLLHDCGKLILDQYFPDEYAAIRTIAENTRRPEWAVEQEKLGIDHGEIGARLLELWGLKSHIVEAVRFHHQLNACEDEGRAFAATIAHADALCHSFELGEFAEDLLSHPALGLDSKSAEALKATLDGVKEHTALLLN